MGQASLGKRTVTNSNQQSSVGQVHASLDESWQVYASGRQPAVLEFKLLAVGLAGLDKWVTTSNLGTHAAAVWARQVQAIGQQPAVLEFGPWLLRK